jgi:hypothetical protein
MPDRDAELWGEDNRMPTHARVRAFLENEGTTPFETIRSDTGSAAEDTNNAQHIGHRRPGDARLETKKPRARGGARIWSDRHRFGNASSMGAS